MYVVRRGLIFLLAFLLFSALAFCLLALTHASDSGSRPSPSPAPPSPNSGSAPRSGVHPVTPAAASSTATASLPPEPPPTMDQVRPEYSITLQVTPENALLSPIASNAENPKALDLQDCFRLTAVRNDTLQITSQDIAIARAQLSQSIAQLFPTFTASNSQEFLHYSQIPPNSEPSFYPNYESSTTVNMSFTIFNGGQNWNNLASAQATVAYRKYLLARNYQTIYQSVAQTFYQALQYQGDIAVLTDLVVALQARDKELTDRVRLGRSRPAELLQSEVTLGNTRVSIEQSKGALNSTLETLAFYVGIRAQDLVLKETQPFPNVDRLEAYLQRVSGRPDVLAEEQNLRAYQRNLASTVGELFPTISASGAYQATQDPPENQFEPTLSDATMTITASIPIFDGGLILSMINQKKQLLRQEQFNLDNLRRTADQDVRTAYANFVASVAQVIELRKVARLSAENLQGQLQDYRRGVVTNLDVLTALQDLQTARQQLHDADMSARTNLINLHVASGVAASGPGVSPVGLPLPTKR